MLKEYLNQNGLAYFMGKLKTFFVMKDNVITDEEIDTICSTTEFVEDSE